MTTETKKIKYDRIKVETPYYKLVEFGAFQYFVDLADALRDDMFQIFEEKIGYRRTVEFGHIYSIDFLARNIETLRNELGNNNFGRSQEECDAFVGLIEAHHSRLAELIQKRLDQRIAEFEDMPFVFPAGAEVTWRENNLDFAAIVKNGSMRSSWNGEYYELQVEVVHSCMGKPALGVKKVSIPAFVGVTSLDNLPVRKLTAELKEVLTQRGKKFVENSNVAYVSYVGQVVRSSYWSEQTFRADGRVMVDSASFVRVDGTAFNNIIRSMGIEYDADANAPPIEENLYFTAIPYVLGFSFRAKQWGRLNIDNVSPIEWREDSYDKLVLDQEKKEMVRAMVEHQNGTFTDLVEGKGGGVIMLLHGEPGQGKTLTAETVSELLRRPLYSVSVGELGTDPSQLEERLREILDIAIVWDATILIDEADIFLEARDSNDVLRNAMVGVFLRLLEYHQGVLFLTTNRVKNIDRAFYSRISIALKFDGGNAIKRQKIWYNLTESAGFSLTDHDIIRLSSHDINGRQIKNIIRISQTMARARKVSVSVDLIERNIALTTEFESEMLKN
jgi:hypothetical protein